LCTNGYTYSWKVLLLLPRPQNIPNDPTKDQMAIKYANNFHSLHM
jgi:hypothetical protein